MAASFEVRRSEKLGRYAVAAKDLRAGETILSEQPFLLGPPSDSGLACFGCHLPLVGRFLACRGCGVAPVCSGGCPDHLAKWHNQAECDLFRSLKVTKGISAMTMVPNVGSLTALRALLKRETDPEGWAEFMQLETHLERRRKTSVWAFHQNTVKFIESLGLLEGVKDPDLVQKICAAIDVNSFDVRSPGLPGLGCSEPLRGVYMRTALLAHDCVGNAHMSINDTNLLVCRASMDIKKGEPIYFNYTDPIKGTAWRQEHLLLGKYFKCSCARCSDVTELGTFLSSALCPECKTGFVSPAGALWTCNMCQNEADAAAMTHKVRCCSDKLAVINKEDEKDLEEYIKHVSLVLAPNHYLLLDAKQRLAGVLREAAARAPRPTTRLLRRRLALCREILAVLETLRPGISRTKAITLYEVHAAMVHLAKKLFDSREITGTQYMDELLTAEKYLKRSLEMLFIEPGNSPEGELCAKALEEYRALKATISTVLDGFHAEGKIYVNKKNNEQTPCPKSQTTEILS